MYISNMSPCQIKNLLAALPMVELLQLETLHELLHEIVFFNVSHNFAALRECTVFFADYCKIWLQSIPTELFILHIVSSDLGGYL